MKDIRNLFLSCAFFVLAGGTAAALEIEVSLGAGNMAFDSNARESLAAGGGQYAPVNFPFGHISVSGEYSDLIDFSFRVERDPLLLTRAVGIAGFDFGFGRFEIGPAAGLFNTPEQPLSAGITGGARIEYPGVIFGSITAGASLASPLASSGDYMESGGEAVLGFWVPNVICAASINVKNLSRMASDTLLTTDRHLRYQFSADVFNKNSPYTVRIDMGYQLLSRSYRDAANAGSVTSDEIKSIYLGFEGTWRMNASLRATLALEMPLYSWTMSPLTKDPHAVFYHADAGIIITL